MSRLERVENRIGGVTRYDALALTAALWFLGKFVRYAFPPLFDRLAAVYDVTPGVLGTAFTGFMLVYAAMQFPSGAVADRLGSVTVVTAGAVVAAAGALVVAVDAPLAVLVAAMLLMGAGTGTLKTVGVRLLARAYPSRTGRALGLFDTAGTFGGVAAPAAVVAAVGTAGVFGAGWRTVFLAAGVAGLACAAAFVLRVPRRLPDAPAGDDAGGFDLRTYLELFREPRFAAFVAVTVLFAVAYNGAVAFLPLYLDVAAGLDGATANLLYGLLFVVSVAQLVTGEAGDRLGALPLVAATLALATAGLVALVALAPTASPLLVGGAVVALGLGAHGYRPVRGAYLMGVFPDAVAGGGLGAVRTLLMGAGALAPAAVGLLSEVVGFRVAFGLLAASLAAGTVLAAALVVYERSRRTG